MGLRSTAASAAAFAAASASYFAIETLLFTFRARFSEPDAIVTASVVHMSWLLLAGYVVLGALLGAAHGLAAQAQTQSWQSRLQASALVLACLATVNAAWVAKADLGLGQIARFAGLALLLVLGVRFAPSKLRFLRAGLSPWAVAAVVSYAFVLHEQAPLQYRTAFAGKVAALWLASCAVFAGASALRARVLPRIAAGVTSLGLGPLAALATVLVLGQIDPAQGNALTPPKQAYRGPKRPNVVLLILDTVRADHTSLFGYSRTTTPFLKQLAKQATIYPRFHGAGDYTLPGHASMFTGLYPAEHGALPHVVNGKYQAESPLADRFDTLAEILARTGYETAGVIANHSYLGPGFGLQQGFRHYDVRVPVRVVPRGYELSPRATLRWLIEPIASTADFDLEYRRGEEIDATVARTLADLSRADAPFLLVANYMDAHAPYEPPEPFRSSFPGRARSYPYDALRDDGLAVMSTSKPLAAWQHAHMVSQYDGAIAYLDRCVQKVVETLKALHRYDDTLLIVTSDHGEGFGEHGVVFHGAGMVYETIEHLPLLVKYPGQTRGTVFEGLASHVDLVPTVLDVIDLAPQQPVQGVSLAQESIDRFDSKRAIAIEATPQSGSYERNVALRGSRAALLAGERKLIRWSTGKLELYDFVHDPAELHDLAQAEPQTVSALAARLAALTAGSTRAAPAAHPMDANVRKRLRALGYAQ